MVILDTVALRFSDNFAPEDGTIEEHQRIIDKYGFVWYGKFGLPLSEKVASMIMKNEKPQILLIQSGRAKRYWARVDMIQRNVPDISGIPEYYREDKGKVGTWFRIVEFLDADKSVMSKCIIKSSNARLSDASRHSMSPYFIIKYSETEEY